MIGDGLTATPLGINLGNANTWTATQTLPTTAAQGDALIASTNSGTTTVNAVRIGNGLTDTQVNNDLTINGGTVDNSPVGATTASTGRFTTITGTSLPASSSAVNLVTSNAGALETRTVSSLNQMVAVAKDATLNGDGLTATPLGLNLGNANTWTATQTLPATDAQGAALIGSVNSATAATVNAARIGNGLTDAQVNNDLTISGGTVNNTPIGATVQSTGRFTTLKVNGGTELGTDITDVGQNTVVNSQMKIYADHIDEALYTENTNPTGMAIVTNGSVAIKTSTATAPLFKVYNENAASQHFVAFKSPDNTALTADRTFTLPATYGGANKFLTADGAGVMSWSDVTGTPMGGVGGDIGGTIANATINNSAVTTAKIAANAVDGSKIALGSDAAGDLMYYNGTDYVRLAAGTNGQVLKLAAGVPSWGSAAVLTNSTLVGDGQTGTELGLNLGTANTWTATQTLPTTAAQGDALVASVNAASTTVNYAKLNLANSVVAGDLTTGSVTSAKILDGTIADADVDANANIAASKLALSANSLMVGNGSNVGSALAAGSNGQILSVIAGTPTWTTIPSAGGWATTGNAVGAIGAKLGTTDNFGFTVITNNTSRLTIDANGDAVFSGAVDVNDALTTESLSSSGNATLGNDFTDPNVNKVQIAAKLDVLADHAGSAVAISNASTSPGAKALEVTGDVDMTGTFNLTGNAVVSQTLTVNGDLNLSAGVTIGNDITDPNDKLQVNGRIDVLADHDQPALQLANSNSLGTALTITDGSLVLSSGSVTVTGNAATISNVVSTIEITSDNNGANDAITLPSGTNGKILYVRYVTTSTDNASFADVGTNGTDDYTTVGNAHLTFIYVGGAWRLMSAVE
jgi:hypothetical protein